MIRRGQHNARSAAPISAAMFWYGAVNHCSCIRYCMRKVWLSWRAIQIMGPRFGGLVRGVDMTSPATSDRHAFTEVRKTAENAASDGFGSNFSGAAF